MKKLILASHGSLARGMKSALNMIAGENNKVKDFNLDNYDSPDEIEKEIEEMILEDKKNEYIIITDIKGGSVCTAVSHLCRYDSVNLVTTMSLPIVLEVALKLESEEKAIDLLNRIVPSALGNCEILNRSIIYKLISERKEDLIW